MASDLKPCPFCGSQDIDVDDMLAPHYIQANCIDCGAGPDHLDQWNTRPAEDKLTDRIAELEAKLTASEAKLARVREAVDAEPIAAMSNQKGKEE